MVKEEVRTLQSARMPATLRCGSAADEYGMARSAAPESEKEASFCGGRVSSIVPQL